MSTIASTSIPTGKGLAQKDTAPASSALSLTETSALEKMIGMEGSILTISWVVWQVAR